MFPLYLTSHFNPAFELLVALLVYASFATSGYFLETFSVYLLVIGLLWTPLVFNPNGLDFTYARYVGLFFRGGGRRLLLLPAVPSLTKHPRGGAAAVVSCF